MSYSAYKSAPRGGRGYIRGYRASSRGGDSGNWRGSGASAGGGGGGGGGGRGYPGSSRGRGSRFASSSGKWERDSGLYESRSRYNSGGERYSSRDEGSYRYRPDDSISSYSSREHSHRALSPERKRMRLEYSPASMHRSHDYGDGLDYSSRSYGGYESKRLSVYGDDRRNLFREERERIRSDDFQFRKPLSVGIRHSTPRGSSYRGRSFSRGLRSGFRQTESYRGSGGGFLRKRAVMESYGGRRRIATGKTQEYVRRLKLYRLQRLKRLRERAENEGSDEAEEEEEEEVEEEQEVEEEVTDEDEEGEGVEKDEENEEKEKKDEDNEDEEMEVGEGDEKKEVQKKKTKKVKKIVKVIKKVKRKVHKVKENTEKAGDNEGQDIHVTVTQDSEGRDVDGPVRKNYLGQPFMKLECPHCHATCTTFKEYVYHLYKPKHQSAMANVLGKNRKALAKLRLDQRNEQRDIDAECSLKNMNMKTFYCLVCKLNYRSLKSEHLQSDKHKELLRFLNPYCKICRVSCRSPMIYETHICSLGHLKRKFYYDRKHSDNQDGNEIDMDKYMVLDQVGSGEEESESETSEGKEDNEKEGEEKEEVGEDGEKVVKEKKPKKKKKQINLGSEYCKKMEIYFCELCKTFLPRIEDQEQALAVHCRGSMHLRWYVKKKDDLALRKRAERIHRLREEQKKALAKEAEKSDGMDEDGTEEQNKTQSVSEHSFTKKEEAEETDLGLDEKVWSEVSKDLGDLLREVDAEDTGNKSSDDEEDSRTTGHRYDRFKHSDKGNSGEVDAIETKSVDLDEKMDCAEIVNGEDDKDDA